MHEKKGIFYMYLRFVTENSSGLTLGWSGTPQCNGSLGLPDLSAVKLQRWLHGGIKAMVIGDCYWG